MARADSSAQARAAQILFCRRELLIPHEKETWACSWGSGFILGSAYTPPWVQKGSCPGLALLVVAPGDQ